MRSLCLIRDGSNQKKRPCGGRLLLGYPWSSDECLPRNGTSSHRHLPVFVVLSSWKLRLLCISLLSGSYNGETEVSRTTYGDRRTGRIGGADLSGWSFSRDASLVKGTNSHHYPGGWHICILTLEVGRPPIKKWWLPFGWWYNAKN